MNLIKSLESVLADSYALLVKTQNYHWNVECKAFKGLHSTFEEQYDDLFEAIDVAAELIRGLGTKVKATFDVYKQNTKIKDGNENFTAEEMVKDLIHDYGLIKDTLSAALKTAQDAGDEVVIAFLVDRLSVHRKNAWILKSGL